MTTSPLEGMACEVVSRTWMKRTKAWRFRVTLPDEVVAAALSNMLEQHVAMEMNGPDVSVQLSPVFISDVPHRGVNTFLDLETTSETQNHVGAQLTLLLGRRVKLSLRPEVEDTGGEVRGDITREALRGLHMTMFPNRRFQEYVGRLIGREIPDPETCKAAFKAHLGVSSCRELRQEQVRGFIAGFNAYLGGQDGLARAAC